ncbi:MAG: SLC13 family permease [Acidobacteriota bacterium]
MLKYLLYQLEYRRYLFLALFVALALHMAPGPAGLRPEAQSVLAIVAMTVLLVLFEPVPLPVVGFLIVILEVVFQIAPPAAVAQSFMSDSVIFIAGSLMLAVAVVKQQLDKRILLFILRLSHANVFWTMLAMLGLAGLMTSFMGEHAGAAIMLPVAMVLIRLSHQSESAGLRPLRIMYLMAIVYGSVVASVGTPSGGARNAIMIGYWEKLSNLNVGYLEWMLFMYPLVLVRIPVVYFVLRRVYHPELRQLKAAYDILSQEMEQRKKLRVEDWITMFIVMVTVVMWIFLSKDLGFGPIALMGVFLCVTSGVLNWEDINHDLNWGIIILYASVISIGLWMDTTGAANWIANGLQLLLGFFNIHGGLPLILVVSVIGMLVGSVLSTGPAIAILGPIVLTQAQITGFSPLVLGMVLVASTSQANFTPVSSPACTIVHGSGMVGREEYFRIGIRLAVISLVITVLFAQFYWPFMAGLL